MRQADIYYRDKLAGQLTEDADGYTFAYDADYLKSMGAEPVSLILWQFSYSNQASLAFRPIHYYIL